MSYIATDIATVPSVGFDWYVIFFESSFQNPLRREKKENFHILGQKVGQDILVVRGFNAEKFHESAYEAFTKHQPTWIERLQPPTLMVNHTPPVKMTEHKDQLDQAKVLMFPLEGIYQERGSITGFLSDLLAALRDPEADNALVALEPAKVERLWGWITKYVNLNPEFYGFGPKLNQIIKDFLAKNRPHRSFT